MTCFQRCDLVNDRKNVTNKHFGKCSSSFCAKYDCRISKLPARSSQELSLTVNFIDEEFWRAMSRSRGREEFWMTVDYEVVEEAPYETNVYKYPTDRKG